MTEIAKKQIKEDLEAVTGVGAVVLVGGEQRAVNVTLDPRPAPRRELSAEDVRQALVAQNLELPGGKVDAGRTELGLRTRRPHPDAGGLRRDHHRHATGDDGQQVRGPREGRGDGRPTASRSRAASRGSTATSRSAWSSRSSPAATRSPSPTR